MGKSAPKAPDPVKTAQAQTGSNFTTATANNIMGQVNQSTPYGDLTYRTMGYEKITDPSTGDIYDVPIRRAIQSLTPEGQKISDAGVQTSLNLANLGRDQSARIGNLLSKPMNMQGLPGLQSRVPRSNVPTAPGLQTRLANAGPVQNSAAAARLSREFGQAGGIQRSYGTDFSQDRQRVEQTLMDRMQPVLDRDRAGLEQRLADQGIEYGSAAYQNAMSDANRQVNDARMGAVLAGGEEQSRMVGMERDRAVFGNQAQGQAFDQALSRGNFANAAGQQSFQNSLAQKGFNNDAQAQRFNQNLQGATFGNNALSQTFQSKLAAQGQEFGQMQQNLQNNNAARAQGMQERFAMRNQPLNEIAALMSGGQVQQPNFMNISGAQMAGTDVAGIRNSAYQNQMQGYNAQQGIWGSLLGAGANLMMLSDRRAKEDIKKVGKLDNGEAVYRYKYKSGGPIQLGLMAQDIEKRKPGAVHTMPGGIKMVDYRRATE